MEEYRNDCDEVLRLVNNMPQLEPGYFYDKPVNIGMTVPIKFGME